MLSFLSTHPQSPYGIRLWAENALLENSVHSYPLYAIAMPLVDSKDSYVKDALMSLAT
jgi:hypothetical protein